MKAKNNFEQISNFFKKERKKLISYVSSLISESADRDSEDIVQDVITNIFDNADITAPIQNLSSYVYTSLRNRVIDIFRKKKEDVLSIQENINENSNASLSDILHDIRYDTYSEVEKKVLKELVFNYISELSPEEQAVIIETEICNNSFKELSLEWDIPIGTLLARKSRAIAKIKDKIINSGYF